jgi:hypothetical protein
MARLRAFLYHGISIGICCQTLWGGDDDSRINYPIYGHCACCAVGHSPGKLDLPKEPARAAVPWEFYAACKDAQMRHFTLQQCRQKGHEEIDALDQEKTKRPEPEKIKTENQQFDIAAR